MRRLLAFLIRYHYWFFFIILEVASLLLLFRYNRYQQSVLLTSANGVVGTVYQVQRITSEYLGLKQINEELLQRNMELERRAVYAESKYKDLIADSLYHIPSNDEIFTTIGARVINNTLHKLDNFITLNRGRSSGIKEDMGVLDAQGVVGIVYKVSDHYSLVISLLNSQMNLSCKIKGTDYFGYLHWEGDDPQAAYLKDLPRHAEFTLGDTIITSGYSTVFPEGLMVGTVDDITDSNDGLSFLLKVKLASNFGALRNVTVIAASEKEERNNLENNTEDRKEQ
ncbi:MAG: rod shape-determining protein MreC [Bacteroidaceae bacterium]|nr:rod shape-determining protein MreC [Bacteroidaceae bacterium]